MARYLVVYNRPNLFKIGPKRFIPGLNEITQEQWDAIKSHPLLPFRFEKQKGQKVADLVWVDGKSPKDAQKKIEELPVEEKGSDSESHSLNGLNAKEAIKLIEETLDLDLLNQWKSAETRKGVLAAIDKQIAVFDAPVVKESEEEKSE